MSSNTIQKEISELIKTLSDLSSLEENINLVIKNIFDCLKSGKKLLICGNGGS